MGRHERVYRRRRETADELSRGVNSFCHIQWVMSYLESIFLEHLQSLYKKPDAYQLKLRVGVSFIEKRIISYKSLI